MPAIADHLLAGADTQQAPGTQPALGGRLWSAHTHTHAHTHIVYRLGTHLSVYLGDVTATLKMVQEDVSIHHPSVLLTNTDRAKYLVAMKVTVLSCVRHGLFCGRGCLCVSMCVCVCLRKKTEGRE